MVWYNSSWLNRKSHIIAKATNASTNYQIPITVNYGAGSDVTNNVYLNSKCRTDFGDIRFTADDGSTLLSYWVESKTDSVSALFWVKVTADLSTVNQTIYIYYNNASVTTTSDAKNTFIIGDGFDNGSLDASWTWTNQPTTPASWVESGTALTINSGGQSVDIWNNVDTGYQLLQAITGDWETVIKVSCVVTTQYHTVGIIVKQDTNDWVDCCFQYDSRIAINFDNNGTSGGSSVSIGYNPTTIWLKIQKVGNIYSAYYSLNGVNWTYRDNYSKSMSPTNLGLYLKTATTTTFSGAYDFIYAKKYVNPEPANSTWGVEENSITTYTKTDNVDIILQKLGLTKTDNVDIILQKLGLTKTDNMDVLFKKLNLTSSNIMDIIINQSGINITDDLDTIIEKIDIFENDNVDVLIKKLDITVTDDVDISLVKLGIITNDIDIKLKKSDITKINNVDFSLYSSSILIPKIIDVIIDAFLLKGRMNAAKESLISKIQTYDPTLVVMDAWRLNKWDFDAQTQNLVSIKIMPSRMNRLNYGSMITESYFGQYYSYHFTLHVLTKYDDTKTIHAKTAMDIANGIVNYLRINQSDLNKGVLNIIDITARESDPYGMTRGGAFMARIIVDGTIFCERPYKHQSEVV
jgi:regulation of enolase protein 1 (concanavalin A-like superfamily)